MFNKAVNLIKLNRNCSLGPTYLDPSQEDCDGDGRVELSLPIAKEFEVRVVIRFVKKRVQLVRHGEGPINIEADADNWDDDHQNIQDVPKWFEVLELVTFDFQDFFHGVVEDEEAEDALTCHDKVVAHGHVPDQLHCAEGPGRNQTTGCRELH